MNQPWFTNCKAIGNEALSAEARRVRKASRLFWFNPANLPDFSLFLWVEQSGRSSGSALYKDSEGRWFSACGASTKAAPATILSLQGVASR